MRTRSKQLTCGKNSDEKARRIMRRAFLRAVWGKAVDGIQVTGGLPSNGMPAGAFRPARE